MNRLTKRSLATSVALLALGAMGTARAQDGYPNRPVTLLVGFAAGGGTDIIARLLGQKLSQELGQQIVIENRAGASGTLAATGAARAEPDGYTMYMGHITNAMVPAIQKVPYDPVTSFTPIMLVASVPQVVTVPKSSPAQDLAGFIAMLKAKPGQMNYASSGTGTQQHLAAELFKQATGTSMTHVPYKGSGQAVNDLIAAQVDVNFDTMPTVLSHIQAGTLRGLAVTTAKRSPALPNVPTIAESGVPGYDVNAWYMVMGPKGLPKPITDRWVDALNKTLADPTVKERMAALATEAGGGTPDDAAKLLKSEVERWAKVVRDAGIKPNN